ncbi:beta-lactamase family protein [Herbiconiux sp. CPCC 205716]|uniref:Beta-lactamase family protein n=1 Tax=Herbiconiux gentiana TaxID=2970912 RepID=A0ABT2GAT3_9MICO|nr:serine hydrolase domain-containing protein [Herbiconiux gentiana]MCS5713270.1 beta-lactamase family protein [Herbiconiux gentiana]
MKTRPIGAAVVAVTALLLAGCASGGSGGSGGTDAAPSGASSPVATRPAAPEGELPAELQSALQKVVDDTMAEYEVPGAAVGVWVPGEGSWTSATGLADVEKELPVSTDMVWPIRSVTKSYTVTLLLQLVDEGRASLDDTIDQYLDGVTDGDTITLRQLAGMTSGNADYTNKAFQDVFAEDPTRIFTLDELNSFALGQPARSAPGTDRVYTNSNINFLGAVIEKITGEPFSEVLQERVLDPLGQTGTEYIVDTTTWAAPHPTGYIVDDGVPEPQQENSSVLQAAGSMFSTLDDGRVWADTLGDGTLVSAGSQSAREEGGPLDAGPPYDLYALGIGETDGWWGHNGEGLGFTAATFHDPQSGASIVVYMNESNNPDAHPADQTFRRLAEVLANGVSS